MLAVHILILESVTPHIGIDVSGIQLHPFHCEREGITGEGMLDDDECHAE